MRNIPIVTKNLLIVNVAVFVASYFFGKDVSGESLLNNWLGLHFFMASDFHIYQLFTYMFMHGGFEHILFNMFALWMFGCVVERVWGPKKFLFYYIVCGVGAGLFQEAAQYVTYVVKDLGAYDFVNTGVARIPMGEYLNLWTTVGASGAIYAILLAFGMIYPNERIFIFPIPIPIKAKYFVMGYAVIELGSAMFTSGDGVAHIAHLGGMVFGFFLIRYWRKQLEGGYHGTASADAFDRLKGMFGGRNRGRQQFTYTKNENYSSHDTYQQDAECTPNQKASQAEIDRILDKIRKSGYDSLTKEEKQTLFDQSNK
ncbi:MAG TPA: rhomboid family intramembrane serine protease [Prevotella sp.]|nr:rhomboid family intramembrane serine protease [uncultured Prevotella sp.]HBF04735.1 rhomboid family intramembrane serine protease [Candidatus Segatella violae]